MIQNLRTDRVSVVLSCDGTLEASHPHTLGIGEKALPTAESFFQTLKLSEAFSQIVLDSLSMVVKKRNPFCPG